MGSPSLTDQEVLQPYFHLAELQAWDGLDPSDVRGPSDDDGLPESEEDHWSAGRRTEKGMPTKN
jgi:hypothetical protein